MLRWFKMMWVDLFDDDTQTEYEQRRKAAMELKRRQAIESDWAEEQEWYRRNKYPSAAEREQDAMDRANAIRITNGY